MTFREEDRAIIKLILSTRELFCVFILIGLNTLKFEEIGVHLWIVKMKFFLTYRPQLKYSAFQLCSCSPKDEKQQGKP